jgi:hypothetical protein
VKIRRKARVFLTHSAWNFRARANKRGKTGQKMPEMPGKQLFSSNEGTIEPMASSVLKR